MQLETFEERLVWARRYHAKLTQKQLAAKMKEEFSQPIGHNYVSAIEKGRGKKPSFEVVRAMAGAMKISLDWLAKFSEDYQLPQPKELEVTYFSPEADEAAQLVDSMRPEQRAVVLSVARNLAYSPTERQNRLIEYNETMDLIERDLGKPVRDRVDAILRSKGLIANPMPSAHGGDNP